MRVDVDVKAMPEMLCFMHCFVQVQCSSVMSGQRTGSIQTVESFRRRTHSTLWSGTCCSNQDILSKLGAGELVAAWWLPHRVPLWAGLEGAQLAQYICTFFRTPNTVAPWALKGPPIGMALRQHQMEPVACLWTAVSSEK